MAMKHEFIPLVPPRAAAPAAGASGLLVLPQAQASPVFVPASTDPHPHPPAPAAAPTVTLVREGDRVTRIRVQCPCGQVIELECAY